MSLNQIRAHKNTNNNVVEYRKGGARSNSSSGHLFRPLSGGSHTVTATATSPPHLSSKKSNNAQGGQSRGNFGSVNTPSNPNPASGTRSVDNGGHVQSALHGVSQLPTSADSPKTDISRQKSCQPTRKAPSSQSSSMTSDFALPSTPAKGDAGNGFSLQFGSISPGFMNGTQVPPRISSAPPNLDEQKHEQGQSDASIAVSSGLVPPAPKQHDVASTGQPVSQETATDRKIKRNMHVTPAPPLMQSQSQRPLMLPASGMSMAMPFHQPTVPPLQFGGPNPRIQSQGLANTSLPMPMQMPLQMGNASQVQQQVYVPGFQHHLMQPQGLIHQGQSLGFNPQLGQSHPHQLGNVGLNMSPQFNHQPSGKIGSVRKTVKITHPETHEELRLDNADGRSPGSRSHHSGSLQSQPMTTYASAQPSGYFSNPYAVGPLFPAPNSLPLTNTQQAPRFKYPVSQAVPTMTLMKHSASSKGGASAHGMLESSTSESVRDAHCMLPSSPLNLTKVTEKAAGGSPKERCIDSNDVEKFASQKSSRTALETVARKDAEVSACDLALQSKPGSGHAKQPTFGSSSTCATNVNVLKDNPFKSDSAGGMQRQPEDKKDFPSSHQDLDDSSKVSACGTAPARTNDTPGVGHAASVSLLESTARANGESSGAVPVNVAIETQAGKDGHTKRNYHFRQGVTEEIPVTKEQGQSEASGDLQLDTSLKALNYVKKSGHDGYKKLTSMADLPEVSQKEVESVISQCEGEETVTQSLPLASGSIMVPHKVRNLPILLSKTNSTHSEKNNAFRLDNGAAPSSENCLESNLGHDEEVIENMRPNSSSGSDKISMDQGNTKNNKAKKKRKEMLQKADAQGTTSDLYLAFKGPEEKKEADAAVEDPSESNSKNIPESSPRKINYEKVKSEFEDWENAADISVTGESGGLYNDDRGSTKRKYSRDFLLTLSEHYTDLPEGFEITSDIFDALMHSNVSSSRAYREHPNTGRIIDRSSLAARLDRRGNGVTDADKWVKLPAPQLLGRNPGLDLAYAGKVMGFQPGLGANAGVHAQGPFQNVGGMLSEPMHSFSLQRNKLDADRWQRATNFSRGLMTSSQTLLQAMHKAENKYEVGKVTDEEQAKQRSLKAILNKLTPQNFEKLFEQVKEVKIDNAVTLAGVISQIFDKALMEPTFCEMYANFCYHLASELPDLSVDNEKITFKRLLLNKCQEEFERGEREEEEANKVDSEGDTKQSEAEREEKRLKARRRMLGNIRLIGELYKKRMLTERIMHECIKKLLGHYLNPDEENIEALCKLMSTIGEMIDHSKSKEHMDAYFDIMGQLSNNMKLSSRARFMLKDAIDLRKNKWQQRRKVEGPKKIEEVHRDVAKERQGQAGRLGRGPSLSSAMRRGPPLEYAPRGSLTSVGQAGSVKGLATQACGYGGKDARMDDITALENRPFSVPLLQRSCDESITLGPQGGLAKGMSFRGPSSIAGAHLAEFSSSYGDPKKMVGGSHGYDTASHHGAYSSREDRFERHVSERSSVPTTYDQSFSQPLHSNYMDRVSEDLDETMHRSVPNSTPILQAGSEKAALPEECLRDKSIAAIKEYYSAKDENEVALCIKDLRAPSFYPTVISIWVTDAFERKDKERDMLAKLLVSLAKPQEGIFSHNQLIEGFKSILTNFKDTVTDAPRAPEFLGQIFGKVISENVVPLKDVGQLIHQGGEESGRLVEAGLAADVLGSVLETIRLEKGESVFNEIRTNSKLRLEDFRPPGLVRSKKLEMFIM